ncbi:hypothetical protein [Actinomadura rudentiformis]|uniref:hypothetical protein n=1 Tax=Actinomadura rudentiformis TaxID=359158 RepID=UPI00178C2D03|nr:hypothetical protein [Actinomadura rudentiformis]
MIDAMVWEARQAARAPFPSSCAAGADGFAVVLDEGDDLPGLSQHKCDYHSNIAIDSE